MFLKNNCRKIWQYHKKTIPLHSQFRNASLANMNCDWQYRGVEQLVARQAHNLEVACSSPASATNNGRIPLK